jgi:hypothetical protein
MSGATSDDTQPGVYFRHDVDCSLRHAVEMARIEAAEGVRATYFVMVRNPLYKLAGEALREMAELGHEIGLHFDCPLEHRALSSDLAIDAWSAAIDEDCKPIEDHIGAPVRAVSFHRPIPCMLRGPLTVGGRVNAYASELMHWYISDSAGRWRCGDPLREIGARRHKTLQVLTHPIWWGPGHAPPGDRLDAFVASATIGKAPADVLAFERSLRETLPGVTWRTA